MAFQPSADFFGIRRLGFKCSWWHPRQANDAVAYELSIFSEKHNLKSCFRVTVNRYVSIFQSLDVCGSRKLRTHTHTRTHACTHTQIHTHARTHTHTHTVTHTHTGRLVIKAGIEPGNQTKQETKRNETRTGLCALRMLTSKPTTMSFEAYFNVLHVEDDGACFRFFFGGIGYETFAAREIELAGVFFGRNLHALV